MRIHTATASTVAMTVLLNLGFLSWVTEAITNPVCNYKMFPVFAGGNKDEYVNAMEFDPSQNFILVGGKTQSANFAPAENDHGFVYALDMSGNWIWGNFFYNVSYAVADIQGIHMSSKNTYVNVFGQANSKPIVMTLGKADGQIKQFLTIEPVAAQGTVPTYYIYGGVYMDETDSIDQNTYMYVTFSMGLPYDMHILRILNKNLGETLQINWHYRFTKPVGASASYMNQPRQLFMDLADNSQFYILGQYNNAGSVMKFQKRDAKLVFKVDFQDALATTIGLTDITAYSQIQGSSQIVGCGYVTQAPQTYVGYFRMENDGKFKYLNQIKPTGTQEVNCRGITYDTDSSQVTLLLTTNSNLIKSTSFQNVAQTLIDTVLYKVSDTGAVTKGKHISLNKANTGTLNSILNFNLLKRSGDFYIWAGHSYGFATDFQSATFTTSSTQRLNTFVFRWLFEKDNSYQCIKEYDISISSTVRSAFTQKDPSTMSQFFSQQTVTAAGVYNSLSKYFAVYKSPYSGAFDLLDTMYIPRPCASSSVNITQMDYFYGQRTKSYDLIKTGQQNILAKMDPEREFVFQNGTDSKLFAWLGTVNSQNKTTVFVQTNDESLVGTQRLVMRGCDSVNNLHEINYYINVSSNSAPEFNTDIQTQWNLNINDNITYVLPKFSDPEGNDVGEVYINSMENQDFPKFVKYVNATQTIIMNPTSRLFNGRTYYFSVVLKEKNSDFMMNTYYMTVKMSGDPVDEASEMENATKISMSIPYLNYHSEGQFQFSHPVNMKYLKENFATVMKVYVNNTEKKREELRDLEIYWIDGSNTTFNFTARFQDPYMYGLLNKRNDLLIFECMNASLLILNATGEVFSSNYGSKRIDMQFDFRDEKMTYMRNTAIALYYVMIAIIVAQFLLLFFKNVGLLPLWTLLEYMQLIAFMPLYNFKLIPYLYDLFKPFLISHLILFDDSILYEEMSDDYFNINYEYYWLPVSKMIQSLMNICILAIVVALANLLFYALSISCKESKFASFVQSRLGQFKFNAYLRLYMLAYFDLTFFSIMKIIEANNSTAMRKVALFFSYAFFVTSIVAPVFFLFLLLRRFTILSEKAGKAKFNSLVLKIDKASRWRVIHCGFFFGRRLLTAMLLTLPIDNQYIFLQYIFILVSSHAYILYMVATKPYQTPLMNAYILANETFYSALIILIFIFSDATPQLHIKVVAGVALIVSIFLLVLANIIFIGYTVWRGKDRLKEDVKKAKQERIEQEEKERQEEEERKAKKKKEEEEFSKVPDDTNNVSQSQDMNNTTHQGGNTTISELNLNKKKGKMPKKKVEDAVEEISPPPKGANKKNSMYTNSKDQSSDDKFGRTGSAESGNPKNRGTTKGGKVNKGISSDDKISRDSNSHDSERGRRIIQ